MVVAILAVETWTALIARQGQILETRTKVANLSSLVAEHAERSIEAADIVLRTLQDRMETAGQGFDLAQQNVVLARRAAELAQVAEFILVDAEGKLTVPSRLAIPDLGTGSAAFFAYHRDHPGAGLRITGPITGLARGRSLFIASRSLKAPDGSFAGVVAAALQTQFYQDFYDALDTGQNGLIFLAMDDGTLLVRHPFGAEDVGRNLTSSDPIFSQYLPRTQSGAALLTSPIDSIERWNAFRHLLNTNLVVAAALSEDEELENWREQTRDQSIAIAAIVLVIFWFSAYLVRQIGKRAEAEQEAAAHAAQYKLLADNSTDIIMRIGFDGVRRYVSPSTRAVLGYEPEEMIGRQAGTYTDTDDRKRMVAAWERLRRAEGMQIITSRVRHKRGHSIWVETLVSAIHDPQTGQPVEMVAVMREISTRKAIEAKLVDAVRELATARDAADQAARAKSRFLAAMSHEIRTPLNTVIGFAELMQKTAPTEDYRRYAELQLEAGTSLLGLINDILDFSKLESGELAILPASVDVVALIEGCVEAHQPAARAKGLDLRYSVATTLPRRIVADGSRLRQILDNLLSNAVKFTRTGTISIGAQGAGTPASPRLRIAVSDTGIGIDEEKVGLLFQRFTQLDAEIDRQFGGTGLGLAISQFLARYMGGEITVESEIGVGSTFTLEVPLQEAEEQREPLPVLDKTAPQLGFHILVAEDDKANQRLIAALLAEAGCTATIVDNGQEAVAAATKHRFDLVLMDVAMPQLDGFQAADRIRRLNGEAGEVPIIALTAHVLPGDAERSVNAGMQAHIGKPINRRELLAAIVAHARRREPARADDR